MSDVNSEIEDSEEEHDGEQDMQMAFVILLLDYKILFDKRQTPAIKAQKEKAATELACVYSKNMKKDFNVKQVMKKFNNMKTKVKKATDIKRTGNKKIILSEWQQKFFELWNGGENPVLNKVPGAVISAVRVSTSAVLPPPPVSKKRLLELESDEPEEFQGKSLQQLQRACLIQQILAARAQEQAAKEMEKYYSNQNQQRDAVDLNNVTFQYIP